jgi:hypothetical protein
VELRLVPNLFSGKKQTRNRSLIPMNLQRTQTEGHQIEANLDGIGNRKATWPISDQASNPESGEQQIEPQP